MPCTRLGRQLYDAHANTYAHMRTHTRTCTNGKHKQTKHRRFYGFITMLVRAGARPHPMRAAYARACVCARVGGGGVFGGGGGGARPHMKGEEGDVLIKNKKI